MCDKAILKQKILMKREDKEKRRERKEVAGL